MSISAVAPGAGEQQGLRPLERVSWSALIGAWLAEVQARTGSDRTPTEYGRYAARFAEWVGGDLGRATTAAIHAFAYAPLPDHRRGGKPGKTPGASSINVRLAALRSLYDFARRHGVITRNPADDVRRPQLAPPTPKGLTPAQIRDLIEATRDSAAGRRDRAIILLAVLTGLRREELLRLTAGSLNFDDDVPLYEVRTKGGKLRRRELPRPAYEAIVDYLEADGRPLTTLDADARLFPITSQTLYLNLRRYGDRADIPGLTIHTLRHTAAKLRRQAGAGLEDVQSLLGHASIATTARYLARMEGARDTGWEAAAALLDTNRA
jgi:integrase/recombinase XerD